MREFLQHRPFQLLALLSVMVLGSVYFIEYVLHHLPCQLCLYQRLPWFGLLIIASLGMRWQFQRQRIFRVLVVLALLSLLASVALAGHHIGVEFGWWAGPTTCGGVTGSMSGEDLKAALLATPPIRCDEVNFRLLGGSLALWNFIVSLVVFFTGIIWIFRARKHV